MIADPLRSFSSQFSGLLNDLKHGETLNAKQRLALCRLANASRSGTESQLINALLERQGRPTAQQPTSAQRQIAERLLSGHRLRLAFINDNGFYAGAGLATARQARSFALAGHQVSVLSLNPSPEIALASQRYRHWLQGENGATPIQFHAIGSADVRPSPDGSLDPSAVVAELHRREAWDLVILGNLHALPLNLNWLLDLLAQDLPVLWFAHDLDLLGGGCGYPQNHGCSHHHQGCSDSLCPKPTSAYPQSSAGRIEHNHLLRSLLFELPNLSLATHSPWSQSQLQARFTNQTVMRIPLGLDTTAFKPLSSDEKAATRRRLGLEPKRFTVVVGADRNTAPGKGGEILQSLLPQLLEQPDLQVLCFGRKDASTLEHPRLVHCGFQSGDAAIARVMGSGDCFLNPVTVEGFGQTMLEASASGCVPVGLRGSGVDAAVAHGRSGILVEHSNQLLQAIQALKDNPQRRELLADEGRERTLHGFSLEQQYRHWVESLGGHWGAPTQLTHARAQERATVSVVTTTLNCAEPLAVTAASLAMQRGCAIEWVVQDGGSSDGTQTVVENTAAHLALRWQRATDRGIYDAANQGLKRCRGDWVLFLQAGDYLAGPDALARVLAAVRTEAADLIVARFNEILIDGTRLERQPLNPALKLQSLKDGSFCRPGPHWLGGMPSHQAMLLRRQWCEQLPFDLSFRVSADFQQLFSVLSRGARVAMSDQVLSWYPNGGFSFDHSHLMIEDQIRIAKEHQSNHAAVEAYFAPVLLEHQQSHYARRQRRRQLDQWYANS